MGQARLEAFSDGVIAIIITIMVLELRAPHGATLAALRPLVPVFLSYVLSFVYVGIYWNNHHHFLHAAQHVNGKVLWANLFLLFWLSRVPVATAWMGQNHFAPVPVAAYGAVLLMAALAWRPFQATLIAANGGAGSLLARATARDWKGLASPVFYAAAIALAFVHPALSGLLYVAVAVMWLVPDRRIETRLTRA
ncbi:MAG: TMEM175 family protein [Lysobacteraceae bacterium]